MTSAILESMSMKRPPLLNSEIYHIILRAVEDCIIFRDIDDYYRGIFSLFEFNDVNQVLIRDRRRARLRAKKSGMEDFSAARKLLVEDLGFNFMPNHIHLLLKQRVDNGITDFMRKFGTGFAYYLNKKYGRKGHIFQGRFSAVHIKTTEQLKNAFVYVHTNPISLIEPNWKEIGINNPEEVIKFLENYKWSSYLDYIGKKNFPSVTERALILEIMGGEEGCKRFVENWVRYKAEIREFGNGALE